MITPTLRELKARSQKLKPVIHVGHDGISTGLVASFEQALNDHGLVKVRFTDFKDERKKLSSELVEKTSARLVLLVGHTATFYRTPSA